MTFQQLLYLVEVSKSKSINQTARDMSISQSNISIAIQDLEKEIHIKCFKRTNRGVELTEEGKELVMYAQSLLQQKKQIEDLYDSRSNQVHTRSFNVSSQRYFFVEKAFINLMNDYEKENYFFSFRDTSFDAIVDDVFSRTSDLGILFVTTLSKKLMFHLLEAKNLKFVELATLSPCVYLSRKHPLLKLKTITSADLIQYPYITYRQTIGLSNTFSEEYQAIPIHKFLKRIVISSRATTLELIASTNALTTGCGLITKGAYNYGITSKKIETSDVVIIGCIYPKEVKLNDISKNFIKHLEESIKAAEKFTNSIRK